MNTPSNIPNLKVQLHILPDLRLPDGCRPHESAQRPRGRIPISTCKPKNISIKNIATQVSDKKYCRCQTPAEFKRRRSFTRQRGESRLSTSLRPPLHAFTEVSVTIITRDFLCAMNVLSISIKHSRFLGLAEQDHQQFLLSSLL